MTSSQVHFAWKEGGAVRRFRTGVSLHSHTMHSKESLDFVPRMAKAIPLVREAIAYEERQYVKRNGRPPNYGGAYWTPVLSEREAFQVEREQIEDKLGLAAHVSLTDHDSIEAPMRLHIVERPETVPVSVEWSVPFGPSFFHLGIHNLPRGEARRWMDSFAAYTLRPESSVLCDLLATLHGKQEVLTVFNHPFWDEKGIGAMAHRQLTAAFLADYGQWIHALELNGMRGWTENQHVAQFARTTGRCAVSGGDRHGLEPNALINLSNAGSFEEFVDEVRRERMSDILVLPQYREPAPFRYAETIWETIRDHPAKTGRVRWSDRFFYQGPSGQDLPFSDAWGTGGPGAIGPLVRILGLLGNPQVRYTLRLAMRATGEAIP